MNDVSYAILRLWQAKLALSINLSWPQRFRLKPFIHFGSSNLVMIKKAYIFNHDLYLNLASFYVHVFPYVIMLLAFCSQFIIVKNSNSNRNTMYFMYVKNSNSSTRYLKIVKDKAIITFKST